MGIISFRSLSCLGGFHLSEAFLSGRPLVQGPAQTEGPILTQGTLLSKGPAHPSSPFTRKHTLCSFCSSVNCIQAPGILSTPRSSWSCDAVIPIWSMCLCGQLPHPRGSRPAPSADIPGGGVKNVLLSITEQRAYLKDGTPHTYKNVF